MNLSQRSTAPEFVKFLLVGGSAFLIDVAVLQTLLTLKIVDPLSGRAISYLTSATIAWWAHRKLTFPNARRTPPLVQMVRFVAINGLGGLLNYSIFAVLILCGRPWNPYPVAAAVVGSGTAMCVNYVSASKFVFKSSAGRKALATQLTPRSA